MVSSKKTQPFDGDKMEHKRKIMTNKIWYLDVCLKSGIYTDILTWKDTLSCGFTSIFWGKRKEISLTIEESCSQYDFWGMYPAKIGWESTRLGCAITSGNST